MKRNLQLSILTFALVFIANLGASAQFIWQRDILSRYNKLKVVYTNHDTYYVLGEFFQSIQLGSTSLTSKGGVDVFLAHYKASTGALLWVRRIGGTGNDLAKDIVYDNNTNLVSIIGFFSGTAEVDMGRGRTSQMVSNGGTDIFVASYYLGGIVKMTTNGGTISYDEGSGIALGDKTTGLGELYITGSFSPRYGEKSKFTSTVLESNNYVTTTHETFPEYTVSSGMESKESFYGKLTTSKGFNYLNRLGLCTSTDYGKDLYWADGFLHVIGAYSGSINFYELNYLFTNFYSDGGFDTYVVRFDPNMKNLEWIQIIHGVSNETPSDIVVNNTNVYLLGNTSSSRIRPHFIQSQEPAINYNYPLGGTDYFLVRLDTRFLHPYSDQLSSYIISGGGYKMDEGVALASDGANIYVIGTFQGSYKPSNNFLSYLASGGSYDKDIFVTKFDDKLTHLQTKTFGTPNGYDLGLDIDISTKGEVLISGYSEAGFGNTKTYVANFGNNNMRLDDEVSSEEKLSIAPNPFVAGAEIVFEIEQSDNYQVEIRDLQGKLIHSLFSGESNEGNILKLIIDEQSLKPGTYILTVKSSDKIYQKKIIKL